MQLSPEEAQNPALIQPGGKECWWRDPLQPYLFLRVRPSGTRRWYFYKSVRGVPHKLNLGRADVGSVDDARRLAQLVLIEYEQLDLDRRIKRVGLAGSPTVREAFAAYLAHHLIPRSAVQRTRSAQEARWSFDLNWRDIADCPVSRLSTGRIQQWMASLALRRGAGAANRAFTFLRAALRYCARTGVLVLDKDPTRGIQPFASCARERYLKPDGEYERLAQALARHPGDVADIVQLLLLTGQRRANVLAMEWNEIDLDRRLWLIPARKAKTRRVYPVALTDASIAILRRRHATAHASPYVFPGRAGHRKNVDYTWHQIRTAADLSDLRLHDLRHTVGTWLGMIGASSHDIRRALNHANIRTSERYVHPETDAIRRLLERAQQLPNGCL